MNLTHINDILVSEGARAPRLELLESKGDPDIDGVHVIGKVKGPMFFPNGISRNKRFYKTPVWENQIASERVQDLLARRQMYGTIGHSTELSEETLKKGEMSHIVSNLYIDPKTEVGMGEALILNTPAGRVLKTVLGAKSQLYVSSRAEGRFVESDESGMGVVDPDTYTLYSFDFVFNPGFLDANPRLMESLNEDLNQLPRLQPFLEKHHVSDTNDNNGGITKMDKVVETLQESLAKERKEINSLLEERSNLKADNKVLTDERDTLVESVEDLEKQIKEYKTKLSTVQEEHKKLGLQYEKAVAEKKKFEEEVGNPKEVASTLSDAHKKLSEWKKFEEEVGTPAQIREALEKSQTLLGTYRKLGTVKEIEECITKFDATLTAMSEEKQKKVIGTLTTKYNITEAQVKDFIKKGLSEKDIVGICESLNKSGSVRKIYGNPPKDEPTEPVQSALEQKLGGSLGERLISNINEQMGTDKK